MVVSLPKARAFQGATQVGFWGKSSVPIYDVPNMHSLNQLVGYIKHINAGNGTVLYRGQCKLYEHVSPSIKHDLSNEKINSIRLKKAIAAIASDIPCKSFFGFKNEDISGWSLYQNLVIEATLQHYGAKTYCVDFVDNLWTALWFGLYEWNSIDAKYTLRENTYQGEDTPIINRTESVQKKQFPPKPTIESVVLDERGLQGLQAHAKKAPISLDELIERHKRSKLSHEIQKWIHICETIENENAKIDLIEKTDHLFLFLYVSDTNTSNYHGVYLGEDTHTIDLRKALPSCFLRPCSQHGWIVKGKHPNYDYNQHIASIIRVNIDLAKTMLGTGELLSQENFFPNESIDQGYNVLLTRQSGSRMESKFKKILPENMITDFG